MKKLNKRPSSWTKNLVALCSSVWKNIFLVMLMLFGSISFSMAQWVEQETGVFDHFGDIDFVNDTVGYVAGASGKIMKTIDGGIVWTQTNTGTYGEFLHIQCIDENIVFAQLDTCIMKTTDGGVTWQNIWSPAVQNVTAKCFYFISADIGYMSQSYYGIEKTIDGGITWNVVNSSFGPVSDMFFINDSVGFIVNNNPEILKTIDGGITWQEKESTTSYSFSDIQFINDSVGFACGSGPYLIKTTDVGETWTGLNTSAYSIQSFYFVTENTGFIMENGHMISRTIDGGNSWTNCWNNQQDYTYGIVFTSELIGYVTGRTGKVYKTINGSDCSTTAINETLTSEFLIYPNPTSNGQVTIETDEVILNVQCYNLMGQLLFETQDKVLNINDLSQGTYLIKVRTETGSFSQKLMVQ
jgi:photosystem II stability/assembly factor-like uncharacterized protein